MKQRDSCHTTHCARAGTPGTLLAATAQRTLAEHPAPSRPPTPLPRLPRRGVWCRCGIHSSGHARAEWLACVGFEATASLHVCTPEQSVATGASLHPHVCHDNNRWPRNVLSDGRRTRRGSAPIRVALAATPRLRGTCVCARARAQTYSQFHSSSCTPLGVAHKNSKDRGAPSLATDGGVVRCSGRMHALGHCAACDVGQPRQRSTRPTRP